MIPNCYSRQYEESFANISSSCLPNEFFDSFNFQAHTHTSHTITLHTQLAWRSESTGEFLCKIYPLFCSRIHSRIWKVIRRIFFPKIQYRKLNLKTAKSQPKELSHDYRNQFLANCVNCCRTTAIL